MAVGYIPGLYVEMKSERSCVLSSVTNSVATESNAVVEAASHASIVSGEVETDASQRC